MRGDTNQKTYKILKRLLSKNFFKCILLSVDKRNFHHKKGRRRWESMLSRDGFPQSAT